MDNASSCLNEKGKSSFKYILFFVIFFALGTLLGVVVTKKFLADKKTDEPEVVNEDIIDITSNVDYKNTIEKLMLTIGDNVEFYDTRGITVSSMPNDFKLRLLYKYILKNNQLGTETMNSTGWGAKNCDYDFMVEVLSRDDGTTYFGGYCNVNKIPISKFNDTYKNLFNDATLDVSQEILMDGRKCVPIEGSYVCGNVAGSGITGELTSKFNVVKATIDKDKVIRIYEKGYLVDTRSNIVNPDDGYDNYYLHSYDNNLYYYELKSSENLTFIHTFNLDNNNNYYYVSTELEKK